MNKIIVPEGWGVTTLGEVSNLVTKGTTPKSYVQDGVNYIKVESLTESGSLDSRKFAHISSDIHSNELKRSQLQDGDMLISIAGSLGRVAIVKKEYLPANTNQALSIVRLNGKGIDPKYCYFFINSEYIQIEIKGLQTVGAQPNLSLKQVSDFQIQVPPLPEQQKIASILTSVDNVIEKTQTQINKLQDLKKGTMNELLTKGIGHTEFKDSPVGKIPKEWEVKKLTEVIEVKHGFQFRDFHFSDNGIPIVKIGHLVDGGYVNINKSPSFIPIELLDDFKNVQLFKNDVLMALTGATLKVSIYFSDNVALQNYRVGKFVSKSQNVLHTSLIYWLLQSNYVQKVVEDLVNEAAQPNIGKSDLEIIKIPVPSTSEQQQIASILTSIDKTIEEKQSKLNQTKNLKKSLMQDLLTGKVRVKNDFQ